MKFRKKPVVIEAVQFNGVENDLQELFDLAKDSTRELVVDALENYLTIQTLEGEMRADVGDWIIKGVQGELYPCKPDIFEKTYEPAPEGE
jgi:hypothetical protein